MRYKLLYLPYGEYIKRPIFAWKTLYPGNDYQFDYKYQAENIITSMVSYYTNFELASSITETVVKYNKLIKPIIYGHFEIVEVE